MTISAAAVSADKTPEAAGPDPSDAHGKALALNLDSSKYGTFAEIGAGQEVARWFLRVGAAAGTVAQTISAYDKTFSDDTYGAGTRYVSRERLLAMLDHEYALLEGRLGATIGAKTRFFVFADTIAARNYRGDNEQHGWIGVRFQAEPGRKPSDVLLHVNLMDPTAQQQQEAIGLLGVNLVYAAFHQRQSPEAFLTGLFDELSRERLEVDVIELTGPDFEGVDARHWCLKALKRHMSHSIVFDQKGKVVEPSDVLRKRPLIVERGKFDQVEIFQGQMLRVSQRQLAGEGIPLGRDPVSVLEMTIKHAALDPVAADNELLTRVQRLNRTGPVIVSDYALSYELVHYLRRYTVEPVRLVIGVAGMMRLLQEDFYAALPGTLLEGLGKVLATNVTIYVYPMPADQVPGATGDGLVTGDDIRVASPINHLIQYLRESGRMVSLPAE